jgi:hypothetical protein
MSELIDALQQHKDGGWPLSLRQVDAIIAALEDRDQLRKQVIRLLVERDGLLKNRDQLREAIDQYNIQRVLDDSHEEGWDLAARIVEQDAEIAVLQAALEEKPDER